MDSYVKGAASPALFDITIGQALQEAADRFGSADALISVEEHVQCSFADLNLRASRIAAGLLEIGLASGDRIGIWSPNCAGWTLIQFAAARAGLILVTLNPSYRESELFFSLNLLGIRALVVGPPFKSSDFALMVENVLERALGESLRHGAEADLSGVNVLIQLGESARPGWLTISDLERRANPKSLQALEVITSSLSSFDAINVQLTSGTTGFPKGATLTHRNILNNARMVSSAMNLGFGDRLCIPVPLYHCFGMVMGNLACVLNGAAMVYPSRGFDASATLAALTNERCTHVYGVPTMFISLLSLADLNSAQLKSLRGGIMAGAPCPPPTMLAVIELMNMREVTIAYGMTETSPVSFQTNATDTLTDRTETVGRIQPHLEAKIVDTSGVITPLGVPGELCVRGYSVMQGYWNDLERSKAAVDADGWMHTGDLARFDDRGFCRIVGRLTDMIIRGGENIYPREIEEFILSHPDIEDVAVFGVSDERYGEEVCAWIRTRAGRQVDGAEIVKFCRDHIAHQKAPRYVRCVDAFPMTSSGKVQKYLIRAAMEAELERD